MRTTEKMTIAFTLLTISAAFACRSQAAQDPWHTQVAEHIANLESVESSVRASAAEALGYLRAYESAGELARTLKDRNPVVRREAAMSLGFVGSRKHVEPLLGALADHDWTVRQGAWVALTNITGMELPFDALAAYSVRQKQAQSWRKWWSRASESAVPDEIAQMLRQVRNATNFALGCDASASTTYKGPAGVLTDGDTHNLYWQTKNVPFPQSCTLDLGRIRRAGCIVVHQYGPGFCMTDYEIAVSTDGESYETVGRGRRVSDPKLVVAFDLRPLRYVRITSFASQNKTYPTTFREIQVLPEPPRERASDWQIERALRALGALGSAEQVETIAEIIVPYKRRTAGPYSEKWLVQAAIRSLGRLGGVDAAKVLIELLDNGQLARYAADALGDIGTAEVCKALIEAYPQYARDINGRRPQEVPRDDRPGLDPSDRMYETPHAIIVALSRISGSLDEEGLGILREIVPLLMSNLPSNFDGAMLYEPEAHQLLTAHLLECANMRRAACTAAYAALGMEQPNQEVDQRLLTVARSYLGDVRNAAVWLPIVCTDNQDIPVLIELLDHEDGWARINAAKALMFLDADEALEPIQRILANSKREADYGYNGVWHFDNAAKAGQSEYNDPPPRWREGFVRALGRLGSDSQVSLLIELLNDKKNALEIQYAAAAALNEIGSNRAIAELKKAEAAHPFHSIRLYAREALWKRGDLPRRQKRISAPEPPEPAKHYPVFPPAVVFIKGDNNMPNDFQIDIWRTTYSTTDSGPTYRIGDNLHILEPARPDGRVRQLTRFDEGFVADCEVSWDGKRIIFAHRDGQKDPWWHIFEINADGTGLRQLTEGPYHDVQPAYLPDGRIIFSSSRIGIRDEYHGYYATGLTVMNPDGSDIHCIGFNLGRDNEPSVTPDGRIVFSRLELFYSRLKTELTVQAVFPDGTKNVTLYGPERRAFWRRATIDSGEKWWGEVPPRHRVLRTTQPQYYDQGRLICSTTGGATIVGPGRYEETVLPRQNNRSVTSPFPLRDGRVLCASTIRTFEQKDVDLGLYVMDGGTGELSLLYNDPETAEFEPRPVMPRPIPEQRAHGTLSRTNAFTATFTCKNAFNTQESRVARRGKLVRVVEGLPAISRHHSHLSPRGEAWKNHAGTQARILGTTPLAADGSFSIETPADRLLHLQILDSDRRVVGNQLIWMYGRPGEKRSCAGCHEKPDTTGRTLAGGFPQAAKLPPVKCLPTGGEFSYRAKFWNKGTLTDEGEERTRTARAVSLIGRQ